MRSDLHHLLRVLRTEPADQHEARAERARDRAYRVRGVDPRRQTLPCLGVLRRRGERERKAGAPEHGRRQNRNHTSRTKSSWKLYQMLVRDGGVDRPEWQRRPRASAPTRPCGNGAELAPAERGRRLIDVAADQRCAAVLPMPRPTRNTASMIENV